MVKKRTRTARKSYESEENDSDSEFDLDDVPSEPAPKKYGLRQRKRALFVDFDLYEEDEDDELAKKPLPKSDDEDFEVEDEVPLPAAPIPAAVDEVDEAADTEYVGNDTYINHIEPEAQMEDEEPDELVDFEDMIRADIVVNKNRIDYDNVIQKTEIKIHQHIDEPAKPVKSRRGRKPKARRNSELDDLETEAHYEMLKSIKRGRKPKIRHDGEIDSSFLETEADILEDFDDEDDADYNPDDDMDLENEPTNFLQTELLEKDVPEIPQENDSVHETPPLIPQNIETPTESNKISVLTPSSVRDKIEETIVAQAPAVNDKIVETPIENHVENPIKDNVKETEIPQLNGDIHSDIKQIENPELQLVCKNEPDEDDDVVLVEDDNNSEVIVLDD